MDENLTTAIDAVQACLKVLKLVQKAYLEIANKRYYQSLRVKSIALF
jgi:hypothetical protein